MMGWRISSVSSVLINHFLRSITSSLTHVPSKYGRYMYVSSRIKFSCLYHRTRFKTAYRIVHSTVCYKHVMFSHVSMKFWCTICSGGCTPGHGPGRKIDRPGSALPVALLCFGNKIRKWKFYHIWLLTTLFVLFWQWNNLSGIDGLHVFRVTTYKRNRVNFFEGKKHPGDLARGCSDLEMTWLLCCASSTTDDFFFCKVVSAEFLWSSKMTAWHPADRADLSCFTLWNNVFGK